MKDVIAEVAKVLVGEGRPLGRADAEAVVSAIRAGVESGTIKGEVVRAVPVSGRYHRYEVVLENPGTYVVIGPVSDGGSET